MKRLGVLLEALLGALILSVGCSPHEPEDAPPSAAVEPAAAESRPAAAPGASGSHARGAGPEGDLGAPRAEATGRRAVLRGRLVTETALGFGEPGGPAIELAVSAPGAFVGATRLDRAKRFELEVRMPELPPELRLDFATGTAPLLSLKARTSVLTSPEGATIRLPLARFQVHVVDARGQPLPGAEVRAKPLPLEREAAVLRGTSDASGLVRFGLPPGEVELVIQLAGHAMHVGMAEPRLGSDQTERVVLRPLEPSERLSGVVVDEAGAPVAGASVSARPRTIAGELRATASFGQECDAAGRFDFVAGANVELEVLARRPDLGFSPALLVPPGAAALRLVIVPRGTLRARLLGLPPGEGSGQGFEWRVVDAQGRALDSGRTRARVLELEPMPCGPLDLHVRALATDRLGSARVEVRPGPNELELVLGPAPRVHGVLLEPDGTPAAGRALSFEDPRLPDGAAEPFARGRTDALGRFDLLGGQSLPGQASEGMLRVEREGQEPLRFPVASGRALELRLP